MSKRVLIVDDEEWIRSVLQDYLEESGFEVTTADTLSTARTHFADPALPDVIVVDMTLPDGNGMTLLDEVRHDERMKEIPFILITAHSNQKIANATADAKPDDCITKPFNLKDFKARLERQLDQ